MTGPSRENAAVRAVLGARPAPDEHLTVREFAAGRRTALDARTHLRDQLRAPHPGAGATPDSLLRGEVELVAYELVTNALRHACKVPLDGETAEPASGDALTGHQLIAVLLCRTGARLTCGVFDPDTARPRPLPPSGHSVSGRGLAIVAGCCARWGCLPVNDHGRYRKLVWAQFLAPRP